MDKLLGMRDSAVQWFQNVDVMAEIEHILDIPEPIL